MRDHRIVPLCCPRCKRVFASVTARFRHVESGSKTCSVAASSDFSRYVGALSAGFLSLAPDGKYFAVEVPLHRLSRHGSAGR